MDDIRIKTYEVFGFERITKPAVINVIAEQFERSRIVIGVPGKDEVVKYCCALDLGIFAAVSSDQGERPVVLFTYAEIMELYRVLPQILAENAGELPETKSREG